MNRKFAILFLFAFVPALSFAQTPDKQKKPIPACDFYYANTAAPNCSNSTDKKVCCDEGCGMLLYGAGNTGPCVNAPKNVAKCVGEACYKKCMGTPETDYDYQKCLLGAAAY